MLVSIIIPTFNRRELLEQALASASKQSYQNIEVIVVDDGSTDGTREFIARESARFGNSGGRPRLRFFEQQNQGAPVARNLGLSRANGEFVMFMDSDDLLTEKGLSAVMAKFQRSNADYIHCRVQEVDHSGNPLPKAPLGAVFDQSGNGLIDYSWHTMGIVYRRKCLESVGGWKVGLKGSQDWEYQVRVKLFGGRGEFDDAVIGYWRQHGEARLGSKVFRPEYVRSVMKACESIVENAKRADRCGRALRSRIARRLLVHAVQWGCYGYSSEKSECLTQAAQTAPGNPMLSLLIGALRFSPQAIDCMMDSAIARLQGRASRLDLSLDNSDHSKGINSPPHGASDRTGLDMLTVIIPSYNRRSRIVRTLMSLSGPLETPLEVLVVDDGSSDDTVSVAEQALETLRAGGATGRVIAGSHRGACAARNVGLQAASGNLVLFLDSDDLAEADGVAALVRAMHSSEKPDVAYGWVWVQNGAGENVAKHGKPLSSSPHVIFDHHWHTSGAIYRKDLLERSGKWNESLSLGDDWDFAARSRLAANRVSFVDVCVGHYIQHDEERLIAREFEKGKSRSVIRAALSIRDAARRNGKLDTALSARIVRRLFVQSVELVLNADDPRAHKIVSICLAQSHDRVVQLLAGVFKAIKFRAFRLWLYSRLRAKRLV